MINPAQIPDEVVNELFLRGSWRGSASEARAAIAATLNAWPGAGTHVYYRNRIHTRELTLPLPQEARDE
jgi:hypothetical protein